MSLDLFRQYVETTLTTQLAGSDPLVKIKYENVKFKQPENQSFVSIYLIEGDSFQTNLGNNFTERHIGILQIDIMTPEGTGTKYRNELADRIGGFFRAKQIGLADGSYAWFKTPRNTALGNEGLFDRMAVSISYSRDEKVIIN